MAETQKTRKKARGSPRTKARRRALQALYQHLSTGMEATLIKAQFLEEQDMKTVDSDYFSVLLLGAVGEAEALRKVLSEYSDLPWERIELTEKAALMIGAFELKTQLSVPYVVVINEAVELARTFGSTDGHYFVNAVLDKVARVWRSVEIR